MKPINTLFILLLLLSCTTPEKAPEQQTQTPPTEAFQLNTLMDLEGQTFQAIEQKHPGLTDKINAIAGEKYAGSILADLRKNSLPLQVVEGVYPTLYTDPYSAAMVADVKRNLLFVAWYNKEGQTIEKFMEDTKNIPLPFIQWTENQN